MTTLNNRTLTIVLVALVLFYVGARIIRVPQREGVLETSLVRMDSSSVRQVTLYPVAENREEIRISRTNGGWTVQRKDLTVEADSNAVKSLLGSFLHITGNRVVTEQPSKWDSYRVGDTSGTRVVVYGDDEVVLGEWWVGEAPAQGGMYGGGQSYMRLASNDKVYTVEGYLHSQYNKAFGEWRNKVFLRADKERIAGVTASGQISWSLKRDSTAWLLNGAKADSAAVERYVGRLASMNLAGFADGFQPAKGADVLLAIEGETGELASVQAWRTSDSTWVAVSSQRPQVYFTIDKQRFGTEIVPASQDLQPK